MRLLFLFALTMLTFFMNACQSENSAENVLLNADEESLFSDAINYDSVTSIAPASKFLMPSAGFYSPFVLESLKPENGGVLRCTFDGAEPDLKTPVFEPGKLIDSSRVVACYEFLDTLVVAKSTQTYFINETKLTMPVVSIRVAPEYVREYLNAPLCVGTDFCPEGKFWEDVEYPAHIEFFAKGSSSKMKNFAIDAGISIVGGGSRNLPKRSVSIVMRKQYQKGRLVYPLFAARKESKIFKSFILRNNGNRFKTDFIGDAVATSLLEGTGVDYQRSRHVVVFYNGVFYGIFDLREKLNEHYIANNYEVDAQNVDFVKHVSTNVMVSSGDGSDYVDLLKFISENDLADSNNEANQHIASKIDLGNFADYMAAEIYFRNFDWPSNNVRLWKIPGMPWKFILFDVDLGMDWNGNYNADENIFEWIKKGGNGECSKDSLPDSYLCFHNIYKKLIANENFKRMFINRASVLYSSFINGFSFTRLADEKVGLLGTFEIQRDLEKYSRAGSINTCGEEFSVEGTCLKNWFIDRDLSVRKDFQEEFNLSSDIFVKIASLGSGKVLVDGMKLPSKSYRGKFFGGNAMLLTAEPEYGAKFKQWEDGSTENPRLVENPVDGAAYSAIFE